MVKIKQITPKTTVTIIMFLAVLVFSSACAISPLSAAELACYRKQKISNKIKDLNTFQMNRSTYIYIRWYTFFELWLLIAPVVSSNCWF
jgi:hypothetical protein